MVRPTVRAKSGPVNEDATLPASIRACMDGGKSAGSADSSLNRAPPVALTTKPLPRPSMTSETGPSGKDLTAWEIKRWSTMARPSRVMVARPEVAENLTPGTHAATFGGNPLACAAAIAALETIEEENLLENARKVGEFARGRLEAMKEKFDFIREVRGKGCMIGVELTRPGTPIVEECIRQGLLINCTHDTVLRMLPSMAATEAEIDEGMDILEGVLTAS